MTVTRPWTRGTVTQQVVLSTSVTTHSQQFCSLSILAPYHFKRMSDIKIKSCLVKLWEKCNFNRLYLCRLRTFHAQSVPVVTHYKDILVEVRLELLNYGPV